MEEQLTKSTTKYNTCNQSTRVTVFGAETKDEKSTECTTLGAGGTKQPLLLQGNRSEGTVLK